MATQNENENVGSEQQQGEATATTPETPAAPATEKKAGDTPLTPDEIFDVLSFDPFDKEQDETPAPTKSAPTKTKAEEKPAGQETPETKPAVPAEQAPTATTQAGPGEGNEQMTQLLATVQQQQQMIQQLLQAQNQPAQPQQQTVQQQQQELAQMYNYSIPPQLQQLLASEDTGEQMQGFAALASGVAQSVHQNIMSQFAEQMQAMQQQMQQQMQSTVQNHSTQQSVAQDFYGKYPGLNNPNLAPIVMEQAKQYLQANPNSPWNEQTRDAIAQRVYGVLGVPVPGTAPAQQQQQQQAPRRPTVFDNGAHQSQQQRGTPDVNSSEAINDVLFGT